MAKTERELQDHALQILSRALARVDAMDEWVVRLDSSIQISWIDPEDPDNLNIVEVSSGLFRPFKVENKMRYYGYADPVNDEFPMGEFANEKEDQRIHSYDPYDVM